MVLNRDDFSAKLVDDAREAVKPTMRLLNEELASPIVLAKDLNREVRSVELEAEPMDPVRYFASPLISELDRKSVV